MISVRYLRRLSFERGRDLEYGSGLDLLKWPPQHYQFPPSRFEISSLDRPRKISGDLFDLLEGLFCGSGEKEKIKEKE